MLPPGHTYWHKRGPVAVDWLLHWLKARYKNVSRLHTQRLFVSSCSHIISIFFQMSLFFLRLNSEAFGFPPFPYGFSSAKINKLFFAPRSKAAWNGGFFHCFSVCSRSNLTICSVICDVVQEEEKINPDKRFTFKGNIFVVKTNYLQKNQQHFMIWEICIEI